MPPAQRCRRADQCAACGTVPAAPVDVVPAKIVKRVTPVAPGNIPAKTSGYVIVRFSIGVNGRVSDLSVIESQPRGVFDQAAQDAVRKWVYEPRKGKWHGGGVFRQGAPWSSTRLTSRTGGKDVRCPIVHTPRPAAVVSRRSPPPPATGVPADLEDGLLVASPAAVSLHLRRSSH
jgi:TonB family protein